MINDLINIYGMVDTGLIGLSAVVLIYAAINWLEYPE